MARRVNVCLGLIFEQTHFCENIYQNKVGQVSLTLFVSQAPSEEIQTMPIFMGRPISESILQSVRVLPVPFLMNSRVARLEQTG